MEIANTSTCECGTWPMPGTYNITIMPDTGKPKNEYEQRGEPRILFEGQWMWYCCPAEDKTTRTHVNCTVDENGNGKCEDVDIYNLATLKLNKGCQGGQCHAFEDLCKIGSGNSVYCAISVLVILIMSLLV